MKHRWRTFPTSSPRWAFLGWASKRTCTISLLEPEVNCYRFWVFVLLNWNPRYRGPLSTIKYFCGVCMHKLSRGVILRGGLFLIIWNGPWWHGKEVTSEVTNRILRTEVALTQAHDASEVSLCGGLAQTSRIRKKTWRLHLVVAFLRSLFSRKHSFCVSFAHNRRWDWGNGVCWDILKPLHTVGQWRPGQWRPGLDTTEDHREILPFVELLRGSSGSSNLTTRRSPPSRRILLAEVVEAPSLKFHEERYSPCAN